MRVMPVLVLTICQFTVFPFLAVVAANTFDASQAHDRMASATANITTVYKTEM